MVIRLSEKSEVHMLIIRLRIGAEHIRFVHTCSIRDVNMKGIPRLVCLVLMCLAYSWPAFADERNPTGKDILVDCSLAIEMGQDTYITNLIKEAKPLPSKAQQTKAIQCMSYVVGFKDAIYARQLYDQKNSIKPMVCLPENNINNGQAVRIVIKYIKDHPELQNFPQAGIVFNAFYYAFPCGK